MSRKQRTPYAVDTSVAVAFLDAAHGAHDACVSALAGVTVAGRAVALAGHAAFETVAVLTRMPGPIRVTSKDAVAAIRAAFPEQCWLSSDDQQALLERLGPSGLSGGMVYDALVAEAARANGRVLLTRDRRAVRTYEFMGVDFEVI